MNPIVMIGGGGHAKVAISVIKKTGIYDIIGYTDFADNGNILGIRYLGTDDVLTILIKEYENLCAHVGIGMTDLSGKRQKIQESMARLPVNFPKIISPNAIVNEDVLIENGTALFDGVIVNTGTRIGKGVIVNTKASIDHDCTISDYVHIAPGVTLSGGVKIGTNCFVGTGTAVIPNIEICPNVIVGAGAAVVRNITEAGTYVGVPAKKISVS
jgi:sugar O-acyltransferase (sialic acid O-acetyltransferase NeuD family)